MNLMQSRQGKAASDLYKNKISKLFPIADPDCSDSGSFDNVLELF